MPRDVRIVLMEPSHPGNIGAAARAMKTMALTRLVLVNPVEFPHPEASARAAGATDILEQARVVPTLDAALAGCVLVAGTSARPRSLGPACVDARTAALRLYEVPPDQDVALVFGRERTGLTNEELDRCQLHVCIPANPGYSSLNLAAAVQIMAYELFVAQGRTPVSGAEPEPPATADELEGLYAHLETAALACGFLDPHNPKHLMRRLRHLFNRAAPARREIDILRGLLNALVSPRARTAPSESGDDVPV